MIPVLSNSGEHDVRATTRVCPYIIVAMDDFNGGTPFGVEVLGRDITHRFPLVTGGWEEGARWAQVWSVGF
jgi:hypothetical protein